MIYAVFDPASRTLTFASAGHLPPLLIDQQGARFLDSEKGMPLGLGFGSFSETQVELSPGSHLVFYSDGITEATNPQGDEYGRERLRDHVLRQDASLETILADVRAFASGVELRDDATVICVKAQN
jgi:sigma-B regulation protein RsbU (phosphoserine phosphatase)